MWINCFLFYNLVFYYINQRIIVNLILIMNTSDNWMIQSAWWIENDEDNCSVLIGRWIVIVIGDGNASWKGYHDAIRDDLEMIKNDKRMNWLVRIIENCVWKECSFYISIKQCVVCD